MTRLPLCDALNINVNVRAISQGMLDMFTEDEKTVFAFGMLPGPKMELMRKEIEEKIVKALKASSPDQILERLWVMDSAFTPRQVVDEIVNAVSVDLYQIGELVV